MKKLNILLLVFLVAIINSCEKEYMVPNEFSDATWYTSQARGQGPLLMGLDDYASFSDLSHNAISHSWELLDEGCYFLEGPITNNDTVYDEFIMDGEPKKLTDKTVHILFKTPGVKRLRMYNEFSEPVSFVGNITKPTVKVGDVWVMDTTFLIDVYDTIIPLFKVFDPVGNELELNYTDDTSAWTEVTIEAGEAVNFVDMTVVGRPNDRSWICPGGSPSVSSDSSSFVKFYGLGVFKPIFESKRTGQTLPYGYARAEIPLKINVIQSSLPFVATGTATELPTETIQVEFSGEFAPFSNPTADFTVNVRNPQSGFNDNVTIQSIEINSSSKNVLDFKLAIPIYNSDLIRVSYTADTEVGALQTVDERELENFSNIEVSMHKVNILPADIYGFETNHSGWHNHNTDDYTGTMEINSENVYSGEFSLKLIADLGNNASASNSDLTDAEYTMEAGKSYEFSYWYYIDNGGSNIAEYTSYLMPTTGWEETKLWTNGGSLGRWVHKTAVFEDFGGSPDPRFLFVRMLVKADATAEQSIMFIDQIELAELEVRPTE